MNSTFGITSKMEEKFLSVSLNFGNFSLALESNFTVKNDSIKVKNHCNAPKIAFSFKNGIFLASYIVNLKFPGNQNSPGNCQP